MKIGQLAPRFRVPALVKGEVFYLGSNSFGDHPIALCFLPTLGMVECAVLERQASTFEREKTNFLGVVSEAFFFSGPWQHVIWPQGLTLLSDPLGRLARAYNVRSNQGHGRCHSFVIDPEGILRYHLVHDLNGRGMGALLEILRACRSGKTPQSDAPHSVIQDRDERVQPLLATSTQGE